jgi:guanylate kinase
MLMKFLGAGKLSTVEPENAYHWMRWQMPRESIQYYHHSLISMYDLVESDFHYGCVYGLPRQSIEMAVASGGPVPVIRTDINGTETLSAEFRGIYHMVTIAVIPDSWAQIAEAIRSRESCTDPYDIEKRLGEDRAGIRKYNGLIHYIIQNTRGRVGEVSGLEHSVGLLREVVRGLRP